MLSHSTCPEATVWQRGMGEVLVPRLSRVAFRKKEALIGLMHGCPAAAREDQRCVILCSAPHCAFSSCSAYALYRLGGKTTANARFLWSSAAPSRVKFFGWFLSMARIHIRYVLLKKTIITAPEVGCSCYSATLEMADHLIFRCEFAIRFWQCLRLATSGGSVTTLHLFDVSSAVGNASSDTFLVLCC